MSNLPVQANFIYIERFAQDCKAAVRSPGVSGISVAEAAVILLLRRLTDGSGS